MKDKNILALCGGVGGAKLALGLSKILSPGQLSVCVNTGDDFRFLGLHISPDIDTVCYTLSGISNKEQGWGIEGETWTFMQRQKDLGLESWFQLGDKDLVTHVFRTELLGKNEDLQTITSKLFRLHQINHPVFPMSNDSVGTKVIVKEGSGKDRTLDFQEYFVKHQCKPVVKSIYFEGIEKAEPSPAFRGKLQDRTLDAIIICPSNPYLSIDPILEIPGVKQKLKESKAQVIAVSPIISGQAIKGPTTKIMEELSIPQTNLSIAEHYQGLVDLLVIDSSDENDIESVKATGMDCVATKTFMKSDQDKVELAKNILDQI